MNASDLRWRLGRNTWDNYFKFTIERNPWDKAVSAYFFATRHKNNQLSFDEWIQRYFNGSSMAIYSIKGQVAVDCVLRYENLEKDLYSTLGALGVNTLPEIPRTKCGFRPRNVNLREIHTKFTRDYVAKVCAPEIEYFGYTFD